MPGVYIIGQYGEAIRLDRHPADFFITSSWDSIDVFYVGF